VLEIEARDRYRASMVNEGGAIHTDGAGTALVTEECLLNRNRNPALDQSEIETRLRAYLGVDRVIWLGKGVINDETDGHIDNLACFVRPGEVALTWTDNKRDPQYAVSLDAWERLNDERDARRERLKIHKIPAPRPLSISEREAAGVIAREGTKPRRAGERLAASYINFYIANGGIVMPLLDPRSDRVVASKLKRLFPQRRVVGVPAREILLGGGNIHCITQQVPVAGLRRRREKTVAS
jgi:agmatine deiminase